MGDWGECEDYKRVGDEIHENSHVPCFRLMSDWNNQPRRKFVLGYQKGRKIADCRTAISLKTDFTKNVAMTYFLLALKWYSPTH